MFTINIFVKFLSIYKLYLSSLFSLISKKYSNIAFIAQKDWLFKNYIQCLWQQACIVNVEAIKNIQTIKETLIYNLKYQNKNLQIFKFKIGQIVLIFVTWKFLKRIFLFWRINYSCKASSVFKIVILLNHNKWTLNIQSF